MNDTIRDNSYDEVELFEEELTIGRGPSKKDIEEIEKEFGDILAEDDKDFIIEDDPRFTKKELIGIERIMKIIENKERYAKKRYTKSLDKELDNITAEEYLALHGEAEVKSESEDMMDVAEVSFDDLNNYEESKAYYDDYS